MLSWILPAACLCAWFLVCHSGMVPGYLLPSPMEVGSACYLYIFGNPGEVPYAGRFWDDAAASLVRVGFGFAVAVVAGLPLGIASGRLPVVQKFLGLSINALRAVPGISWMPLAVVWFGIGLKTTVFLVGLAAFFPIFLNAAAGVQQVDPLLLQAGAMMGCGRIRSIFTILLPSAMPHLLTGLRLGLGISWAYLVLGELSGVPNGLGALIMDARMTGRIEIILVGIILIAIMGRLSDTVLKSFMRFCFKSAGRML